MLPEESVVTPLPESNEEVPSCFVQGEVVVLSVLFETSSLLLLQEMMVRLKRNMEKMISRCFTWFPISGFVEPNI